MKRCADMKELHKEFKSIKSGVADDTIFMAKALLYLCEAQKKPKKRAASRYMTAVGRHMREGKPIQEAHRLAKMEVKK